MKALKRSIMNCVMKSTGQMEFKVQDSIMRLTQDLQAARALTVITIVIGFIGMLLTFVGGQCSSCLKKEFSMAKVLILGGILCIVAGVVCLIPVCWSSAYTISDFQSVLTIETQKRELGASIYIGWGASGFSFINIPGIWSGLKIHLNPVSATSDLHSSLLRQS